FAAINAIPNSRSEPRAAAVHASGGDVFLPSAQAVEIAPAAQQHFIKIRPSEPQERGARTVAEFLKPQTGLLAGLKNWGAQRTFKGMMPTTSMSIDPKAKPVVTEGEIGTRAYGLRWPAMNRFDIYVFARMHGIELEGFRNASQHVPGGPSGHGRDSYDIVDRGRPTEGEVFFERRLSDDFTLRAMSVVSHESYAVARGYHVQMAPNKVQHRKVQDRLALRISKQGDEFMTPEQRERLQARLELAERIAVLRNPAGLAEESPYRDVEQKDPTTYATRNLLGDIDKDRTGSRVSSFSYGVALQAGPSYPKRTAAINTYIAALIDVFSLSDADFAWLSENLR
ncbi:hypothetical protein KJ708_12105, partial [bacterium]|nr:hypothetical protein [bacterium]